jgi:hypothetical protein
MKDAPKVCPICGKNVTNGVGPSDMPEMTKFLNSLPSSYMFHNAADWHDYGYHLGGTEADRKSADEFFYNCMMHEIKSSPWYLRAWYKIQAYRNYIFVRKFGGKFFNFKGCRPTRD